MINNDLYNNQYAEELLIKNINSLCVDTILRTQTNLSVKFIDNYILNPKYNDDCEITMDMLLHFQPQYGLNKA